MNFNPYHSDLPIVEIFDEVKQSLTNENTLIVNAPAGAGKSTLLPLAVMHENWLKHKKIVMLEPRRLAAKTIAMRMAQLLGEEVGQSVGYKIRFESCANEQTKILVVTEGILTRMLQSDNALEKYGLVIFDEFHERSLFADVALALSRECQQVLRSDLRIMIMSATLNIPQLAELLEAPVVKSSGRQYPVDIRYAGEADVKILPELAASLVVKILKEETGDILVFLPGEGEIKKCEGLLKKMTKEVLIYPLYGQLPPQKQIRAILPDKNKRRKIVLATSIAETSLTIEGIKVVVDCGFARTMRFDPRSGLSRLVTQEITIDAADQRAGRAGRLGPGVCYRMWTLATHHRLNEHRTPEIMESDLASMILDLATWGISRPEDLFWLTPPPKGAVSQAKELLHQLEALDEGKITSHGKQINKLPCHPRIAHMLSMAEEEGLEGLACDIAALLEERDPLDRQQVGVDINLRIEALRKSRNGFLKNKLLTRIERVSTQYRKMLKIDIDNTPVDPYETGLLLVHAYPERIAHNRPGNNAQFKLANGKIAAAGHKDNLAHEAWLAVADVYLRDNMGKIFLASPLNPKDLASLVKQKEVVEWDTKKGGFSALTNLCIGHIILQSKPLHSYSEEKKVEAISAAIQKEGENLLDWNEEVKQWQNRVLSLRKWDKKAKWPDVSMLTLMESNNEWLGPYLFQVKKPEDLKRINLKEILHHSLPFEKQSLLEKLAPERIVVPTGSRVKLKYYENGEPPVLAVRLQEVFGMLQTPAVYNSTINVLMHLLSPGFKLVQITSDLNSFWTNVYFEVRKEMKMKYPKHKWPDNPVDAAPNRK